MSFKADVAAANLRQTGRTKPKDKRQANKGMALEACLEKQHEAYRGKWLSGPMTTVGGVGTLVIKVPTLMVPGGRDRRGNPIFRSAAKVVDFMGALEDGEAIAIEAKDCSQDRWPFSKVRDTQIEFMRQWTGIGLLVIRMNKDNSVWAVPFYQFLRALDGDGPRSWPLPGHTTRGKPCADPSLSDVGCRLARFDWHGALRSGRLDRFLFPPLE